MDTRETPGTFITFEGGEGGGKSTHIFFVSAALKAAGRKVVRLREPGGTALGEALRTLVLDPAHSEIDARTELYIYEAARAQLTAEVIAPALAAGAVVLCDRFTDSTLAYQGAGRGLDLAFIEAANAFATDDITPDRTLVLACGDGRYGLVRATHDSAPDRLEQENQEFHDRVNDAFLELAAADPERVRLIDSTQSKGLTAYAVFAAVADLFGWRLPDRAAVEQAIEAAGRAADAKPLDRQAIIRLFTTQAGAGTGFTPETFAALDRFSSHG